jgi:hypothetical protein
MAVVAIAGILTCAYVWLFPPTKSVPGTNAVFLHSFYASVVVGGYVFPHNSPIFWVILTLILAIPLAIFGGMIAVIARAVKVFKKRRISNL